MANRNQNYQSRRQGSGRQGQDYGREMGHGRDDDEGRYSSAEDDRNYGPYTENDEGDSSVRAGSYDQGRGRYGRDTQDQSGSTGRYAGYGNFGQGDYGGGRQRDTGQERYGQNSWEQSGRGGGYGGSGYGSGYGQAGGSNYGGRGGQERQSQYGGGSRSFSGYGYGGSGTFNEPYGEGQQHGSRGQYGGESGAQGFGGQGSNNPGFSGQSGQGFGYGSSGQWGQGGQGGQNWGQGSPGGQSWSQGGQGSQGSQSWGQGGQSGQSQGLHRGKGPKGYQRSDDRIKEMICERLREDPEIDPSDVTITVQGGKVTLDGTVDSRTAKNSIEDIAEQFGSQEVQNNLRVQRVSQTGETATGTGGKSRSDESQTTGKNKH